LSESELGKAKSPTNNVLAGAPVETLESPPAGTPLTDHVTDQVKPGGKGGAEGDCAEEVKSLSELELGKAKSPLNNVLIDASARKEASTTGEEVYEVYEHFVEKRPSRNIRVPKKERSEKFCSPPRCETWTVIL